MSNSEHLNAIVREYLNYRQVRSNLKKQYQADLKRKSKPALVLLGERIMAARAAGFRVESIMQVMGMKNRNFMYEAIAAFNATVDTETPESVPEPSEAPPEAEQPVIQKLSDSQVNVTIGTDSYTLAVTPKGIIQTLPEEWLTDVTATKKKQVQGIIADVKNLWGK